MHPEPELLLQQAATLVAGQPDQTALRTAANRAYYAVFHHILRYITDTIVGQGSRNTNLYRSVYRHIQHEQLRTLCHRLAGPRPDIKITRYEPSDKFGQIIVFARLTLNLYEQREYADYDPVHTFDHENVRGTVADARTAIQYFNDASAEQRGAFVALLLLKLGKRERDDEAA
jgi:uncharacterized protein (UPF0332 family)